MCIINRFLTKKLYKMMENKINVVIKKEVCYYFRKENRYCSSQEGGI